MVALNALAVHSPETHDLAFKLRRKRFIIEKLHLPPEIQEEESSSNASAAGSSVGCGGGGKKALDF